MNAPALLRLALCLCAAATPAAVNAQNINGNAAPPQIQFIHGAIDSALTIAKKEDKIVFVDCYTTWCGPCRSLSSITFRDSAVAAYFSQHYVSVKMDMEKPEGLRFARKYTVSAYPTLYFLSADGEVLIHHLGFVNPDELLHLAASLHLSPEEKEKRNRLKKMDDEFNAGNRQLPFLLSYYHSLRDNNGYIYSALFALDSVIRYSDLKNDSCFEIFSSLSHSVTDPRAQAFGKDYQSFYAKHPEASEKLAASIVDATLSYLIEVESKEMLALIKTFVNDVWTGDKRKEMLGKIAETEKTRKSFSAGNGG